MADTIQATPRNMLMGLLADALGEAYNYAQRPDPTMPMGKANAVLGLLSDALPLKSAATVLNDLSYGQAPIRGTGMTTRLTPEATELAINALPFPRTAGKVALMGAGAAPGLDLAMFIGPKAAALDAKVMSAKGYQSLVGTRDEMRQLIRGDAERLAETLRRQGFDVGIDHSGSALGPSSYLSVYDPTTGRSLQQLRISNHSKGPFEAQHVTDLMSPDDFAGVLQRAQDLRAMGKSQGLLKMEETAAQQADKTRQYWETVGKRATDKQAVGAALSNREKQALQWLERNK